MVTTPFVPEKSAEAALFNGFAPMGELRNSAKRI
jgi:hypothetical protein